VFAHNLACCRKLTLRGWWCDEAIVDHIHEK